MSAASLTNRTDPAHMVPMNGAGAIPLRGMGRLEQVLKPLLLHAAMLGATMVGGCVTLEAPDQPIVIELNINITQEVIYRLAEDAGNAIEENADIF
tara:strand:+ start:119 stop:406 length:288 start_codon:yes stop_codon:yes gene_type:complete